MPVHGYEIKNSLDFFRKLLDEREDFLKNPTSSRHAINWTLTAWHLHEWIYCEFRTHPALARFNDKTAFRTYLLTSSNADFHTIHDLADGSKHFTLTQRKTRIVNTQLIPKGRKLGRKELAEPVLLVTTVWAPGSIGHLQMTFDDLLYLTTLFWYEFFLKELKADVGAFIQEYTAF